MNTYFPSEYWPLEHFSNEYWPTTAVTPVVSDVCGCITIEDENYFNVTLLDEAV
jgi:hypothetical protein